MARLHNNMKYGEVPSRVIRTAGAYRLQQQRTMRDNSRKSFKYYRAKYDLRDPDFLMTMVCCPYCPRRFLSIQALKYHHLNLHAGVAFSKLSRMLDQLGDNETEYRSDLATTDAVPNETEDRSDLATTNAVPNEIEEEIDCRAEEMTVIVLDPDEGVNKQTESAELLIGADENLTASDSIMSREICSSGVPSDEIVNVAAEYPVCETPQVYDEEICLPTERLKLRVSVNSLFAKKRRKTQTPDRSPKRKTNAGLAARFVSNELGVTKEKPGSGLDLTVKCTTEIQSNGLHEMCNDEGYQRNPESMEKGIEDRPMRSQNQPDQCRTGGSELRRTLNTEENSCIFETGLSVDPAQVQFDVSSLLLPFTGYQYGMQLLTADMANFVSRRSRNPLIPVVNFLEAQGHSAKTVMSQWLRASADAQPVESCKICSCRMSLPDPYTLANHYAREHTKVSWQNLVESGRNKYVPESYGRGEIFLPSWKRNATSQGSRDVIAPTDRREVPPQYSSAPYNPPIPSDVGATTRRSVSESTVQAEPVVRIADEVPDYRSSTVQAEPVVRIADEAPDYRSTQLESSHALSSVTAPSQRPIANNPTVAAIAPTAPVSPSSGVAPDNGLVDNNRRIPKASVFGYHQDPGFGDASLFPYQENLSDGEAFQQFGTPTLSSSMHSTPFHLPESQTISFAPLNVEPLDLSLSSGCTSTPTQRAQPGVAEFPEAPSSLLIQLDQQTKLLEECFQRHHNLLSDRLEQQEKLLRQRMKLLDEREHRQRELVTPTSVKREVIEIEGEESSDSEPEDMFVVRMTKVRQTAKQAPNILDNVSKTRIESETETTVILRKFSEMSDFLKQFERH